jgi:hypothetical protein
LTTASSGASTTAAASLGETDDRISGERDLPTIITASVLVPLAICVICVALGVFVWKKRKQRRAGEASAQVGSSMMPIDASGVANGSLEDSPDDHSAHDLESPRREPPDQYADIPAPSETNSYYSLMPAAPLVASNSQREPEKKTTKKKSSRRRKASDGEQDGDGRVYESTIASVGGSSAAAAVEQRESARIKSTTSLSRRKKSKYVIDSAELQRFEMVGKGAFGEVYRGEWRHVAVAVKDMKNIDALSDLLREAEELKSLQPHRNVIEFYGVVTSGDNFSIVTAFASNGALSNLLYGKGKIALEPGQLQNIALGAAAGVRHLHAENVIHRDLAARNILVDDQMTAKIADFGMSRTAGDDGEDNTTMTAVGPVRWMAPEQMAHRKYSRASDVFAFGVVLFEIFTASPPWPGLAPLEVAAKVMGGETLVMPSTVDGRLSKLAASCWRREPKERPSMSDVHSALSSAFSNKMVEVSDDS